MIELLTVIAIIAILSAILLPVIGSVRQAAKASVAMTNLRELATSAMLYADDRRGQYPKPSGNPPPPAPNTGTTWVEILWAWQYPGRLMTWDTYSDPDTIFHTPFLNKALPNPRSWAINESLMQADTTNRRLQLLPSPARTMIFGDSWGSSSSNIYTRVIPPRTNGKIAFVYLDGHVALLKPDEVPTNTDDSNFGLFWRGN